MRVVIDRFEGDFAVCEKEDRTMLDIRKAILPNGVREGDVLLVEGDRISYDEEETIRRRKHIGQLTKDLWS